jgi:two-component system invasion response regulator UvrY
LIRILLVDDQELIRVGLKKLLADIRDIHIVDEAATGEEAIELAYIKQPDVILMDIQLPDIDGVEAAQQILKRNPYTKIIAFSAYSEKLIAAEIAQVGLVGYLTKDTPISEVINAIRQVESGQTYIDFKIAQQLAIRKFDSKATSFESLSPREKQVAELIIEGYDVQEISDQLDLSFKTVNTYRYRLFEKLGVSSNLELAKLAARYHLTVTEQT